MEPSRWTNARSNLYERKPPTPDCSPGCTMYVNNHCRPDQGLNTVAQWRPFCGGTLDSSNAVDSPWRVRFGYDLTPNSQPFTKPYLVLICHSMLYAGITPMSPPLRPYSNLICDLYKYQRVGEGICMSGLRSERFDSYMSAAFGSFVALICSHLGWTVPHVELFWQLCALTWSAICLPCHAVVISSWIDKLGRGWLSPQNIVKERLICAEGWISL